MIIPVKILITLSTMESKQAVKEESETLKNGFSELVSTTIPRKILSWPEHITEIDLSNSHLCDINEQVKFPINLETLNLSFNHLVQLPNAVISMHSLTILDVSYNNLRNFDDTPNFFELENLQTCILSSNHLEYIADEIMKLKKLVTLHLDSNELYALPETLCELPNLQNLDLYDNYLFEVPEFIHKLKEVDVAQNYCDEPDDFEYNCKRERIRLKKQNRQDGRKEDDSESEHTKSITDDEYVSIYENKVQSADVLERSSSPEDWDSDDYWVPPQFFNKYVAPSPKAAWLSFVKKKMEEGSFCPMDIHPVSVYKKVQYEKMCNPPVIYESDGQFDDCSDDDS